ncbi:MAG: ZIP family metal transporter [Candidatus Tectomicrobia bacterium]|nr:ZIP family metal transporter [Candidatus Tectomicrobia bacterium]
MEFLSGLLFGLIAALGNLFGGLILTLNTSWDQSFLKYFLAFGAGFMLSTALLRMIPESMQATHLAPLFILLGYLGVHLAEHGLVPHFHFGEEVHREELLHSSVGLLALTGLLIHAFFDGVSIGSGFLISSRLGVLVFSAVLLHKIPEGFTISSIMLASGYGKYQALNAAIALGISTMLGALLTSAFAALAASALAISAGVTIYVAASDLIPEVNQYKGVKISLMVFMGVALFYLTDLILELIGLEG